MTQVTVQDIQSIAVGCVSDFLNKSVPLSEGLAKQASDRGLNTDQLKRAVEATNTLAYLKSLEVSPSRTGEFQVADYNQILKMAFVPENLVTDTPDEDFFANMFGQIKRAETLEDLQAGVRKDLTKRASEMLTEMTQEGQERQMLKYASINAQELKLAKAHSFVLADSLTKVAAEVRKDPQALEKLSAVTEDKTEFLKLAGLVLGEDGFKAQRRDFVDGMFNVKALEKVSKLQGLLKEAEANVQEVSRRQALSDQADTMTKQAFLVGALGAAAAIAGKKIAGTIAKAPEALGKGVAAVAKAPFKLAGAVTKPAASGTATFVKNKTQNAFASTSLGKKLGVPTKPVNPKIARNFAAAGVVGMAALDSTAFSPKIDPANDNSGTVWDALHR